MPRSSVTKVRIRLSMHLYYWSPSSISRDRPFKGYYFERWRAICAAPTKKQDHHMYRHWVVKRPKNIKVLTRGMIFYGDCVTRLGYERGPKKIESALKERPLNFSYCKGATIKHSFKFAIISKTGWKLNTLAGCHWGLGWISVACMKVCIKLPERKYTKERCMFFIYVRFHEFSSLVCRLERAGNPPARSEIRRYGGVPNNPEYALLVPSLCSWEVKKKKKIMKSQCVPVCLSVLIP
jgi:hypothetical protein